MSDCEHDAPYPVGPNQGKAPGVSAPAEGEAHPTNAALEAKVQELEHLLALMRAALDATTDGMLLTDNERRIVEYNDHFVHLWNIPPESIAAAAGNHLALCQHIRTQVIDPEKFLQRIDEIYRSSSESTDLLHRVDGTVLERYSRLQFLDGQPAGRVWNFRDVTARSNAEELRWQLAAIVESSNDAIIGATLDGVITTWNAAAVRMFGYTADEIIGKPVPLLYPKERRVIEARNLERIRRGERVESYETQRLCKDGRPLAVSLSVSPIRDEQGHVVGMSKIARDITHQKQLELEREQLLASERAARSEAERASQLKDEFLATLSHELRTPLNAIVGWSQILRMEPPEPTELEEGLEAIERNARAQTHIIEDLLDMSRIISGKVRLDVHQVDLASVIDGALAAVRPSAEAREITLRKILDTGAGPVAGDATRLQQVLWNLLSNAVKFTPKGGKVDIYLQRVNSHLEVVVRDSGIGIEPEFLPIVFERFRQIDSSSTRNFGGLGLGLSIAKSLVELHGGTISVKSEGANKGTTFTVALPLAPLHDTGLREHPATARSSPLRRDFDLKGVKVLVVDDEADARMLVSRMLAECGAQVLVASTADEALALLPVQRPHVLVSDIGMPGKDGYHLIEQARQLPDDQGGATPALALTAFARSEDRTRAIMAGYQGHIAKPIEAHELAATIASLAGRLRHYPHGDSPPQPPTEG